VGEPSGRNTAPACGVAAALGRAGGADPLQLVVPADHWIPATGDFWRDADTALALAAAADAPLVTLGIPVRRPETGYGYIERGAPRPEAGGCFRVARFHEKPDAATAQAYAASGGHYWNSGIFAWRAGALLEEIDRHLPELGRALEPLRRSPVDRGALPAVFGAAPAISIDHGVLERSGRVAVVAAGFAWNDVGNWSSWAEQLPADAAGNVGRGARVSLDAQGCVVYSDSGLVATLGVRDLVVVRSGDVTLVVERSRCQEIRRLLDAMRGDAELKGYL
jgi:mannose-1-phosphate guanylyltransferase/mannose-6-phosphate isomerase